MDECILLTATIDPGRSPVFVKDPLERLEQYVTSVLLWATEGPFEKIVFCENSAYQNLDPIREAMNGTGREIEIISFDGNGRAQDRGKGCGEADIMEKAFLDSKVIRSAWTIWKVTGRLYVPNAGQLQELHKDHRHVMTSDTRYFKISQNFFWCHLFPASGVIDDRRSEGNLESVYGHIIAAMNEHYLQVFREPISFVGQQGGSGMWYAPYPEWAVEKAKKLTGRS